ncbi:MAG TPA: hypothetical protein PKA74_18975 [Bauldia sp.]|nr:hypothetical protein [Bauldia sp.]
MRLSLLRLAAPAAAAVALAATALPAAAQSSDLAYNTATRVGAAIETCWFKSGDGAFASYVYSPEPNASGGPRILIVPRDQPAATPLLAIQFIEMKGGISIRAFGPLATSSQAPRIGADLKRWLAGGTGCQ